MSTKVGIVGSGIVGQTLANGFVTHGYDVMIGTNTPGKREELTSKTKGKAKVGSFEVGAAKVGEVEFGPGELRPPHVTLAKLAFAQVAAGKVAATQIDFFDLNR